MRSTGIALLFGTVGVAACTLDRGPVFAPSALSGPFALQTVNGAALPAAVFDSANPAVRLDALSGVITIKPANAFTNVTTFRQTVGAVISTRTVTCVGTYTAVGNVFQFVEAPSGQDCGLTFTGVLSGAALTASVIGAPAVFSQ
jgi:hypothetical protein